jgi:site-specific recombinase XerD
MHIGATHLLEDGLDIVTIKDLLGHECIQATMVYPGIAMLMGLGEAPEMGKSG